MLRAGFARGRLIHADGSLIIKPTSISALKEPAEGFHKIKTLVFSCEQTSSVPKTSYDCSRGEQVQALNPFSVVSASQGCPDTSRTCKGSFLKKPREPEPRGIQTHPVLSNSSATGRLESYRCPHTEREPSGSEVNGHKHHCGLLLL